MFSGLTLRKLRSEDGNARRLALERLKSLDDTKVLDEVVHMMVEDKNGSVRSEAEKAIQRTKPAGAANRLKDLLHDKDPEHRYSAARSLQGIGWMPNTSQEKAELQVGLGKCDQAAKEGKAALEALTLEVTSAAKYKEVALDTLVAIGEPAVPHLLAIVRSPKLNAGWVAQTVAKGADKVCEAFFIQALKDPHLDTEKLCEALAKRSLRGATTTLIEALSGVLQDSCESTKTRRAAATALAKSGNELSVDALKATLRHDPTVDTWLRSEVVWALAESKATSAVQDLISVLAEDASENVRARAARALGSLGDAAAKDALMNAVGTDPDESVVVAAVEALSALNARPPIERLLDLLQSLRAYRSSLVTILGKSGDQRATRPLVELLETDSNEGCRESCARALGQLGGRGAIEALERVPFPTEGGTEYGRWAAAQEALNEIAGEKGKWRAIYERAALQEAVSLGIVPKETLTEFPPMTVVAKVIREQRLQPHSSAGTVGFMLREDDRRPFNVCGMVYCRQCGPPVAFKVSVGAGVAGATLSCNRCQSQMNLLISKHPQLGWREFFVCACPLMLRGGELIGHAEMHIVAVG